MLTLGVVRQRTAQGSEITKPTVSIIIVNYKTAKQTKLCLRSLRRFTLHPVETIVIDNRSDDESSEYLSGLSWIRCLENDAPTPTHRNGLELGMRHCWPTSIRAR